MKRGLKIFLVLVTMPVFAFAGTIERVSVTDGGVEGNSSSQYASVSSDGRYVVFESGATNLVASDTNVRYDIFVYDRDTNTIERVSITDGGVEGNGNSNKAAISATGRYIAFHSIATNLVAGDTNAKRDIFVYDRDTNTIERVSVTDGGVEGNNVSSEPAISADGRYVAFHSTATNLVANDTNARSDIFVYDRDTNTIERVSVTDGGVEGNHVSEEAAISADGRFVAFTSYTTNLVASDTNGAADIFVYDRDSNTIERVSVNNEGVEGDFNSQYPALSSDGRYVTFYSFATNLVAGDTNGVGDIFVYDRNSNTIERVSVSDEGVEGDGFSQVVSAISGDGRYVAFYSDATNLVAGDTNTTTDVFVYDRTLDAIERVSIDDDGVEGDNGSGVDQFAVSSDGRYVALYSIASNLVANDTNVAHDVFVVDRMPSLTVTNTVNNDNSGLLAVGDFPLFVNGIAVTSGVATTTLTAGTYTVSQTNQTGYTATVWGGDCAADGTITLAFGDDATCTITNNDDTPLVVEDSGGGSSSRSSRAILALKERIDAPIPPPIANEKKIIQIQQQLIDLLTQIIALLIAQRGN